MGTPRRWQWADNVLATGDARARAMVGWAHPVGGRSVVVGDPRGAGVQALRYALGCDAVKVLAPCDALTYPLARARHVVVDLTAAETATAFAVVRRVLDVHADGRFAGELQVVATDPLSRPVASPARASCSCAPEVRDGRWKLWLPIVSEGSGPALAEVHDRLAPDQTCPVLPFPAHDPRRADNLLLEHRALLVDAFDVDLGHVVYAHERDPFDLYRTLAALAARHPPGELVVSPTEPSMAALGAFLASYELGLALAWAHGTGPRQAVDADDGASCELTCVWLAGQPYLVTAP